MKNTWLKSVICIVLSFAITIGAMPLTILANPISWFENANTEFEQNTSSNNWEEIEKNSEVILQNPNMYEKIDGSDLKGAEVSHNQNSRTYLLEDGTYLTRFFDDPITYTDENGKEVDIDNTLKAKGKSYVNTDNAYQIKLPKSGEGITIENKGYTLQLKPQFGILDNEVVEENFIRYNNVSDGVDLQYTVNGSNVKEDIILNKPINETEFSYEILCENLYFKVIDNIVYGSEKDNNEPIFIISAPIMTDNSGEISQEIRVELEEIDERKIITIKPDNEWINAKERAFPVYIDPTINLNSSNFEWYLVENGVGTSTYPAGPNVQHISNPYLYSGFEKGNLTGFAGLTYGQTRSYIKINYDFSTIPNGTIIDAKLKAYKYAGQPSSGTKVYCKMVTSSWRGSRRCWNTQPTEASIIGAAADVSGGDKWVEWDISTAVSEWKNGRTNYGLVLAPEYENQDAVCFSGPGNQHGRQAMYFDIFWTVPNAVDENLPLNAPNINLRALTETNSTGKQTLNGVFADGVVRPTLDVNYRLNSVDSGEYKSADYGRIYPDSDMYKSQIKFTLGYKDLHQSNWQSKLFTGFSNNVLYNVYATATNGIETTPEGKSDSFIVYQFTEQDTLPYIAKFYGVSLDQIIADNRPQDYLGFSGNTFFIRNPQKNATIAYTRPDNMTDEQKRTLIYANLGRGMHSEFDLEPINVNIGNYYFESIDASSSEYNGTFLFSRSYNSIGSKSYGVFGTGWTFAYSEKLSGRSDGSILYTMGDGKQLVFKKSGNEYISPDGYYLNLKKMTGKKLTDIYYTITKTDGTVSRFNCYGLLESITDSNGFSTTIQYDSNYNINGIKTASGRQYIITTNNDGQITSVRLPNGGMLKYEYKKGNLVKYINADNDEVNYVYNSNGQLTEWYDGNNNRVVKNEYDKSGKIIKQTDSLGNTSTIEYSNGETTIKDALGNKTAYYYDSLYRTTKVDGSSVKNASYNSNNELSTVSANGMNTSYEYNSKGDIIKKVRADGSYQKIEYDELGNAVSVQDYDGTITYNTHDKMGNVLSVEKPDGSKISYTYDSYGQVTSLTDGNGNKTTFEYIGLDKMIMTDPNNNSSVYYYDAMGQLINEVDPDGNETKYIYSKSGKKLGVWKTGDIYEQYLYDGNGNCVEIIDPEGYKCTFTYNSNNQMIYAQNPLGGIIEYSYDKAGNKISETDPLGNITKYKYNNKNQLVEAIDPTGRKSITVYDTNGMVSSFQDFDGTETTYEYDYILGLPVKITDKTGTMIYTYDKLGRIIGIEYPDGTIVKTVYDSVGNISSITAKNGLVTNYSYDKNGNLISESDSMGNTKNYKLDSVGNLIETENALGQKISYAYDKLYRTTAQISSDGEVTYYSYDAVGNIVEIIYPNESSVKMAYDKNGNIISLTDGNGNTTQYKYDGAGDLVAKIDALGNVESYAYNIAQNLVSYVTATSDTTTYQYDSLGRVVKTTDPEGYSSLISYDDFGNIKEIENTNGSKTSYLYNDRGYLVKAITADGLVTEYEYDNNGNVIKQWDNCGNIEESIYDNIGNLVSKTDSLGRTAEYSYDLYGNTTKIKDYNGDTTEYSYDLLSRLISKTEPNRRKTEYQYDNLGNLISSVDADGSTYLYQYDNMSQLIKSIDPLNQENSFNYDKAGNLVSKTDAAGNETRYTYSKVNTLLSKTNENGATEKYEYDAAGRVIKYVTAEGNVTEYIYDGRGNITKVKDPLGYVTEYVYDEMSNVEKVISARGAETKYTYNNSGLCLTETDAVGAVTKYEYSPDGKLLSEILANDLVKSYEYDELGRILSVSDNTGLKMSFAYDERGNVSSQTDQDGNKLSYDYDNLNQLICITDAVGAKTKYEYDAKGNVVSIISPTGAKTNYDYDILNRVTSVSQSLIETLIYTYDKVGQISSIAQGDKVVSTEYDSVGNKVSVTNPLGDIQRLDYDKDNQITVLLDYNGNKSEFEYDSAGNIVSQTNANGYTEKYTRDGDYNITSVIDALGNKTEYRYDMIGNLTAVKSASGAVTEYSYDSMGNLVSKNDAGGSKTEYSYDLHNNLVSIISPNGAVEQFIYDINSRLEKAIKPDGSTIEYNYDNINNLLSKTPSDDSDVVTYGYDSFGNRVTMDDESGQTTYEYDILGRVTSVTNGQGHNISYEYDEYGRINKIYYPENRVVSYTYDLADNLLKVEDSDGETTEYTYDKNGNVLTCSRSSGIVTNYGYDSLNQVVSVENIQDDAVLSSFFYAYNGNGQIISEEATQGNTVSEKSFEYDVEGQLSEYTEVVDGEKSVTKYSYSDTGNRIAVTKGADEKTTVCEYNSSGQLIQETDSSYGITKYTYDENGNLIEKDNENSEESITYSYDIENRLTAVREGGALLMAASYDGDGNRVFQITRQKIPFSVEKSNIGSSPENSSVQDSENLESAEAILNNDVDTSNPKNDSSALSDTTLNNQAEVYTYYEKVYADPADTIFWYGFGQSIVQFFGNFNASLSAYLSDWFCHVWDNITDQYKLKLNSETVYSDEDIEAMRNAGLTDEDIDEITSSRLDWSSNSSSEYSGINQTSEKTVDQNSDEPSSQLYDSGVIVIPSSPDETTRIDYDLTYYVNDINTANTQVLMTYGRNDSEKAVYTYGNERIAEDDLQTDTESDYLYDGRGSVVQTVVDNEINTSITYDAYGSIKSGADENFVGFAYNGEETNMVTGLQYLRARYYDTAIGSFTTIDSYLGSVTEVVSQNRYTYANNDPVNNIDPSGHYSVNTRGTSQYYKSTGLNEMRDFMTAAGLWAGEVEANNAFNSAIVRAQNTGFMNYQSISGISQSTANAYILNGVLKAGLTSMNYGCSVPTVPNESITKFQSNVNSAKSSANAQISRIKANKKAQYDAYQAYLRWLEEQRRIAEQLAKQQASQYNGITKSEYANSLRKKYNITSPYSDDYVIKNFGNPNWNNSQNLNPHFRNYYSGSHLSSELTFAKYAYNYGLSYAPDLWSIGTSIYNYKTYNFGVYLKDGKYAIIKGARSPAAYDEGILGTRYALKNADDYLDVFKYVDGASAMKYALKDGSTYVFAAFDVGIGVWENIENDASTEKIITDAGVDAAFSIGGTIFSAGLAGATSGLVAGSVAPGVGNAIGAGVGFLAGVGFAVLTDVKWFDGGTKSLTDKAKDGIYSLFGIN